jgi:hypothetical protein
LAGSSVDHTQPLSIVTPSPGPLRFTLHRNAGLSPGQQKVSGLPPASFFFSHYYFSGLVDDIFFLFPVLSKFKVYLML